jgi:dimethylamine/trimethylamine dehydrogenase
MVSQVRRKVLDFIGAARPSIADPFLPEKIRAGRSDEIRECIGCNVCASTEMYGVPIRCTQNATIGEEWRKSWHPEIIPRLRERETALVVGAGPAGLEAALTLARRGLEVSLVEAAGELGGRLQWESRLPGARTLDRVREHRVYRLERMANVNLFRGSALTADEVIEFGAKRVVLATGAHWRVDGIGPSTPQGIAGLGESAGDGIVRSPESVVATLAAGGTLRGPVVVYDDDHYCVGHGIAELLRARNLEVTLVTPLAEVSQWSYYTLELRRLEERLAQAGIVCLTKTRVNAVEAGRVALTGAHAPPFIEAGCFVPVTLRAPADALLLALAAREEEWRGAGIRSVDAIGDMVAPGTVAAAVYAGAQVARELGAERPGHFLREAVVL